MEKRKKTLKTIQFKDRKQMQQFINGEKIEKIENDNNSIQRKKTIKTIQFKEPKQMQQFINGEKKENAKHNSIQEIYL